MSWKPLWSCLRRHWQWQSLSSSIFVRIIFPSPALAPPLSIHMAAVTHYAPHTIATLYELRSSIAADKKRELLIEVAKWCGDGLRTTCLKMPL